MPTKFRFFAAVLYTMLILSFSFPFLTAMCLFNLSMIIQIYICSILTHNLLDLLLNIFIKFSKTKIYICIKIFLQY